MGTEEEPRFLDLREYLPGLAGPGWRACVLGLLERALGFVQIRRMMEALENRVAGGEQPFEAFVAVSGIHLDDRGVVDAVPRSGGVVVIANHPFGGADAVALPALVNRARNDVLVMSNAELSRIKAVGPSMLSMEIMGQEGAGRRNVAVWRKALGHLQAGGTLVMFPAGAVAHWQWGEGRVEDPQWSDHAARLLLKAQVPVLPVGFSGRNPGWFHFFGALHPFLRSALIPRAFLAARGRTVTCAAGGLFTPADYPESPEALTRQLRKRVAQVFEIGGN